MSKSTGIDSSRQASNLIDDKKVLPERNKAQWNSREAEQVDTENMLPTDQPMDKVDNPIHDRSARLSTSSIDSGIDTLTSAEIDSGLESLSSLDRDFLLNSMDEGFSEKLDLSSNPLAFDNGILGKELGSGRFGKVYLVEQKTEGKNTQSFALKTAQGRSKEEKKSNLEKLQHEVQVLKALGKHPNIVECGGLVKVDGEVGVLFGLIEGPDLSKLNNNLCELFEKGEISLEELSATFAFLEEQKLDAMTHLQVEGFVHGDLKPSNFMWDSESKLLKLIDFGQSVSCRGEERIVCGHEDFTPPEAINSLQGSAHSVPASITIDSYSLGQMPFMMYDYLLGGQGHAFNNGAKTQGLSPGQRTEKAFLFRQAMRDFTEPNSDGSYKRVIEDISFDELMMQISEKDQPTKFDPLYDKAAGTYQRMQVLKPMADYTCRFMHPIAEHRATANEMRNHPWVNQARKDVDRVMAIIDMAVA